MVTVIGVEGTFMNAFLLRNKSLSEICSLPLRSTLSRSFILGPSHGLILMVGPLLLTMIKSFLLRCPSLESPMLEPQRLCLGLCMLYSCWWNVGKRRKAHLAMRLWELTTCLVVIIRGSLERVAALGA